MELLSHNNLWYGIPLYVEYEYYDDEDLASKRTAPVDSKKKTTSSKNTSKEHKVVVYTLL